MSELQVFRMVMGPDTVVAASPEDAWIVWAEHLGEHPDGYQDSYKWEALAPEAPLTIRDDDGRVTKTCAEWTRENGRGFLCSTEW